jgi:hypothetical protein
VGQVAVDNNQKLRDRVERVTSNRVRKQQMGATLSQDDIERQVRKDRTNREYVVKTSQFWIKSISCILFRTN